jgi:exodeoxyribonuclease VII large subunit
MDILSLSELGKHIKQVIALNFVDSMWIACEISQINMSRGHSYLNLVEKDEHTDEVIASMSASIWFRDLQFIRKKLGIVADKILQNGMEVKLKVELEFHERYGLKLVVKDIDPSYTFGQLAINKEQIIQRLKDENRLSLNRALPFPTVIQKIAIISSETAAGLKDLTNQLENNQFGFTYKITLFPAAMQGQRTEMEVISQLREIKKINNFDIVILTRGGGSKLDLAAFDSYHISKEISEMNIPVITGIGHEVDSCIVDLVSAVALKTPTAVANFIIDNNASFESELYNMFINMKFIVERRLQTMNKFLDQYKDNLKSHCNLISQQYLNQIHNFENLIEINSLNKINSLTQRIQSIENILHISSPDNILKRGYAIPFVDGKNIKSVKNVKPEDKLILKVIDGEINTIVK